MQGLKSTPPPPRSVAAAQSEASKMLEAALLQMDGIISGAAPPPPQTTHSSGTATGSVRVVGGVVGSLPSAANAFNERNLISATNVLATAKTLALALQQVGVAAPAPDPTIAAIINDWLETHIPRQDADERLRRLQRDKESLALQYQMLAERVSEQADRISELECTLTERTQQLSAKEELLQRQAISRSALETQKLELMSALSELKLHRAALERENGELRNVDLPAEGSIGGKPPPRPAPYGSMGNLNHFGQPPKTPPAALRHQIHPQFHSLPRASHVSKNSNNNNNSSKLNNNYNTNNNRSFDGAAIKQRNVAFASHEKILIEDNLSAAGGGSSGGGGGGNDLMYDSFISQTHSSHSPSPSNLRERSAKGLRNIFFGKLRRSNSGNLELPALEQAEPEFKRGVTTRATAGGRIEWTTQSSQLSNMSASSAKCYADWSPQEVCNWLCDLVLGCYEEDCRKWLKSNPSVCFFTCAPQDIERELNLKLPLHRKKIQLAIDELTGREGDVLALKAAQLDVSWVLRWLDDIGLPQYKDTFAQAKVDGRMLHRLTMEDLAQLHVTSCLHIASLRCGIQCMRSLDWNPESLIRRSTKPTMTTATSSGGGGGSSSSSPSSRGRRSGGSDETIDSGGADEFDAVRDDDEDGGGEKQKSSESVALWTAHRVMEWLRVADLSEYAPNLRGAGVHGALMLYEPRFNAALLADLLSIPPSKTLLRRHLATHFKELLGRTVLQGKRDAESAPGYQPLTISAKLKAPKKTQFSLKRRKSTKGSAAGADIEWTDYVCPMVVAAAATATTTSTSNGCVAELEQSTGGAHNNSSSTASSSTSTNNSNSLH